jgi:Rad3-related DNA helicase
MKLDVPKMVMEVMQAAGRLLRTMDDYGVVAILDRKITEEYNKRKSYASILVNNLPFTQVCYTPGTVNKFLSQFKIMDKADEKKKVEDEKTREEQPCFAGNAERNSPPC